MEENRPESDILAEEFEWADYTPSPTELTTRFLMPKRDMDLPLFFNEWLKNGRNATQAYKMINPHVSDESARTLGSRKLAKVDKTAILSAYGLTFDKYFEKLKEGMDAKARNEATGEMEDDFKTRRIYHRILGELLGLEKKS